MGETTLYSTKDGRVECEEHAPRPASDARQRERYRVMNTTEQAAWRRMLGTDGLLGPDEPLCEVCLWIARRAQATADGGAAR